MKKQYSLLIGFLALFGLFFYYMSTGSEKPEILKKIRASSSATEVKNLVQDYDLKVKPTDGHDKSVFDACHERLATLKLSQEEIDEIATWLAPKRTSLRVIVIPDLSNRITKKKDQVERDKKILAKLFESFKEETKLDQNSSHFFIVDVTDRKQANGNFSRIADSLVFDLSKHVDKSNRHYFAEKEKRFLPYIDSMYALVKTTAGADFTKYIDEKLRHRVLRNTVSDHYRHKVIILTDGYLDPDKGITYTPIKTNHRVAAKEGTIREMLLADKVNIPPLAIKIPDVDILLCEFQERTDGDRKVLEEYWRIWFERMDAKSTVILPVEEAIGITIDGIKNFIKRK